MPGPLSYRPSPAHPTSGRVRLPRWGLPVTRRFGCRQDPESGAGLGAARRALAGSLPAGELGMRGARPIQRASWRAGVQLQTSPAAAAGEAVSPSARPALSSPRETASPRPGADGGGLGGSGPGRGLSPGRLPPGEGSRRLRGSHGPEGGSEVRAPQRRAPTGVPRLGFFRRFSKPAFVCRDGAVPGAASAFVHSDCFQLVSGARCARALPPERVRARVPGPPSRCPPSALGAPAGWAEETHTVLVIFPGNLSFRRYTCVSLVLWATPGPNILLPARLRLGLS